MSTMALSAAVQVATPSARVAQAAQAFPSDSTPLLSSQRSQEPVLVEEQTAQFCPHEIQAELASKY